MERSVSSRITLDVTEEADLVFAVAVSRHYEPTRERFSAVCEGGELEFH